MPRLLYHIFAIRAVPPCGALLLYDKPKRKTRDRSMSGRGPVEATLDPVSCFTAYRNEAAMRVSVDGVM